MTNDKNKAAVWQWHKVLERKEELLEKKEVFLSKKTEKLSNQIWIIMDRND